MTDKRWTFLLVKDGEDPVRQLSVSSRAVRWLGGTSGIVFLLVATLTILLGIEGSARLEAHRLATKNVLLEAELGRLRAQVDQAEQQVAELARLGADFRVLAGLESIDEEVLLAGVGGPGRADPTDSPFMSVDPETAMSAFALSYDLSTLERRTRLLSVSLLEASDSLRAHRELLESMPSILPTAGFLSSRFSTSRQHPIHHTPLPHEGIDVAAPQGTPILAAAKGTVVFAGRRAGYGLMVEIDHGFGYVTRYGHASKLLVRPGQKVNRGLVIAQVGSTGYATSPHLHYEIRVGGTPRNPLQYVITGAVP